MRVTICRHSGPVTDVTATSDFEPDQLDVIKDVVAMINVVTGGHDQWYVQVEDGSSTIPEAVT